jgi:hypothetical protein
VMIPCAPRGHGLGEWAATPTRRGNFVTCIQKSPAGLAVTLDAWSPHLGRGSRRAARRLDDQRHHSRAFQTAVQCWFGWRPGGLEVHQTCCTGRAFDRENRIVSAVGGSEFAC